MPWGDSELYNTHSLHAENEEISKNDNFSISWEALYVLWEIAFDMSYIVWYMNGIIIKYLGKVSRLRNMGVDRLIVITSFSMCFVLDRSLCIQYLIDTDYFPQLGKWGNLNIFRNLCIYGFSIFSTCIIKQHFMFAFFRKMRLLYSTITSEHLLFEVKFQTVGHQTKDELLFTVSC